MANDEPSIGPLQLVVVEFESIDRLDGEIARELRDLRGRGLISIVDARLLSRSDDGELTELDLNEIIGEPVGSEWRPVAHLFGFNGRGPVDGAGGAQSPELYARTAGFSVEDLRRITEEIGDGEHAVVVLVEHRWAARLRALVRERGGRLAAQGLLTPEVMMIVGAEMQARADAEAAIELADAARGAALLRALETLTGEDPHPPSPRAAAAAAVVAALVNAGFVRESEAAEAIDALAERGIVEQALLHGAVAEAEELLAKLDEDEPEQPDA
jgi:uncharacterized membrane protein